MGRIAPWSNAAKRRFVANPEAVADWRNRHDGTRKLNGLYTITKRQDGIVMYDPPMQYPRSAYADNMGE